MGPVTFFVEEPEVCDSLFDCFAKYANMLRGICYERYLNWLAERTIGAAFVGHQCHGKTSGTRSSVPAIVSKRSGNPTLKKSAKR